jgi:hypothetical protein
MIWYLLTAIGFPPCGSDRQNFTQIENKSYIWGETKHKTKTQNTQNGRQNIQKHKTSHSNITKNNRHKANNIAVIGQQ